MTDPFRLTEAYNDVDRARQDLHKAESVLAERKAQEREFWAGRQGRVEEAASIGKKLLDLTPGMGGVGVPEEKLRTPLGFVAVFGGATLQFVNWLDYRGWEVRKQVQHNPGDENVPLPVRLGFIRGLWVPDGKEVQCSYVKAGMAEKTGLLREALDLLTGVKS